MGLRPSLPPPLSRYRPINAWRADQGLPPLAEGGETFVNSLGQYGWQPPPRQLPARPFYPRPSRRRRWWILAIVGRSGELRLGRLPTLGAREHGRPLILEPEAAWRGAGARTLGLDPPLPPAPIGGTGERPI